MESTTTSRAKARAQGPAALRRYRPASPTPPPPVPRQARQSMRRRDQRPPPDRIRRHTLTTTPGSVCLVVAVEVGAIVAMSLSMAITPVAAGLPIQTAAAGHRFAGGGSRIG